MMMCDGVLQEMFVEAGCTDGKLQLDQFMCVFLGEEYEQDLV